MNLTRSTFLVAGLALLAGACGDDVTVTENPTPTPVALIRSVEVAPATATVTIPNPIPAGFQASSLNVPFTAAINADPGLTPTVAWAASAGTITSAGVWTPPTTANAGISICATATAGTQTVRGCATVSVVQAAAVIPASISISRITVVGNLNNTVDVNNVNGQIDFTMNLTPGNQIVDSVAVFIDGRRAAHQGFTAAQSAELAAQTAPQQITLSVNTAAYDTTTGAVTWFNGNRPAQARVFARTAGQAAGTIATSPTQPLFFRNTNGFHGRLTFSGTPQTDALGYRWQTGTASFSAIPVVYTQGLTVTSANISWGSATCGAVNNGAAAAYNVALAAPAAGAFAWTGSNALAGYEFRPLRSAGCTTTRNNGGETPTITAITSDNNNLVITGNGFVNANAAAGTTAAGLIARVDNWAWFAPVLRLNPNSRSGGWINDAVQFNAPNAGATSDGWIDTTAASNLVGATNVSYSTSPDSGAGGMTFSVRTGTGGGTVANAIAGTARTNAVGIDPSPLATNATAYCAVPVFTDRMGNNSVTPTLVNADACGTKGTLNFGVDRAPPSVAFQSNAGTVSMAANLETNLLATYRVTHVDTGVVGNSGFAATAAVRSAASTYSRRTANAASAAVTPTLSIVNVPNVADTLVIDMSALVTDGYYTTTVSIRDQAGNATALAPRVAARDASAPTLLVPTQVNVSLTGGTSQTFNSSVTENNALKESFGTIAYATTSAANFLYGPTTINTFNTTPAVISTSSSVTVPFFMRGAQQIGVAGGDSTTLQAQVAPTQLVYTVKNFGGPAIGAPNATTFAAQTYNLQNVQAATAYTALQIQKGWISGFGAMSVSGAGGNPATRTFRLNINTQAPSATTAPTIFSRVELWRADVVTYAGAYRLIGTTTTLASVQDNGAVRTASYDIPFTATSMWLSATGAAQAANMVMVGYNANGDAIVTAPVSVTVNP